MCNFHYICENCIVIWHTLCTNKWKEGISIWLNIVIFNIGSHRLSNIVICLKSDPYPTCVCLVIQGCSVLQTARFTGLSSCWDFLDQKFSIIVFMAHRLAATVFVLVAWKTCRLLGYGPWWRTNAIDYCERFKLLSKHYKWLTQRARVKGFLATRAENISKCSFIESVTVSGVLKVKPTV